LAEDRAVRILVADDNEVNQFVIKGMLESEGFLVNTVCNGKEAITAMHSTVYDLVIMDCLMPVLDGFEATKTIRKSEAGNFDPGIPILGITSLSSREDRMQCLEAGMNDCISKPVEAGKLLDRLTLLLKGSPSPALDGNNNQGEQVPETEHDEKGRGIPNTGLSEIMQSLSPILLRDARAWQTELKKLVAAGSVSGLGTLAHKIRGTADVIGKSTLSGLCSKLEAAARTGNLDQVSGLPDRIITELTGLIEEVQA